MTEYTPKVLDILQHGYLEEDGELYRVVISGTDGLISKKKVSRWYKFLFRPKPNIHSIQQINK